MENHVGLRAEPLLQKSSESALSNFADEAWDSIKQHKTDILIGAAVLGVVGAGSVGARALIRAADNGTRNLARFTGLEESPSLRPFLGKADHHIPNLGTFEENSAHRLSPGSLAVKSELATDAGVVEHGSNAAYTQQDHVAFWEDLARSNPHLNERFHWDGSHMNYGQVAELEGSGMSSETLRNVEPTANPSTPLASDNAFFAKGFDGFGIASSDDVATHEMWHGFLGSTNARAPYSPGEIELLFDLRAREFVKTLATDAEGLGKDAANLSHTKL